MTVATGTKTFSPWGTFQVDNNGRPVAPKGMKWNITPFGFIGYKLELLSATPYKSLFGKVKVKDVVVADYHFYDYELTEEKVAGFAAYLLMKNTPEWQEKRRKADEKTAKFQSEALHSY